VERDAPVTDRETIENQAPDDGGSRGERRRRQDVGAPMTSDHDRPAGARFDERGTFEF
jgi:hypothetical protein